MVIVHDAYRVFEVQGEFHPFVVSCLYQKVIVSSVWNSVYRDLDCFDRRSWNDVDLLLERLMRLEQKQPWRQRRPLSIYADE